MIGKQFFNYKITKLIGTGGMASVYEAEHVKLSNKKVAIKVLDPILARNKKVRERFKNEANIMAGLEHDNIISVSDFDDENDYLVIIMELLNGIDLKDYIHKYGALQPEKAVAMMKQILEAFAYAHHRKIVHRDVKPSNVFIETSKKDNIKILDFGIAKLLEGGSDLTNTGAGMGTPLYMSPEQVDDVKHIDHRSDIYSLGVTFYYMLAGKAPYEGTELSNRQIFNKIADEPLPKLQGMPEFDIIIQNATAKKLSERYQSCEEFIVNLENYKEAKPVEEKTVLFVEKEDYNETIVDDVIEETNNDRITRYFKGAKQLTEQDEQITPDTETKKNKLLVPIIVAVVIVILGIFIWQPRKSDYTETVNNIDFDMIYVSGGGFKMGSNENEDEKPIHQVNISSFYIGKYEVTQALWEGVMGTNPSEFKGDSRPIESISWDNIQIFIRKLNQLTGKRYRLPTEAEWEYAAGGGSLHQKYAGTNNKDSLNTYAWHKSNSGGETHNVGTKRANTLGIYDMSGNVYEWCQDWFKGYSGSSDVNDYIYSTRVVRGGRWSSRRSNHCRSANRYDYSPNDSNNGIGFRLCID